jgi:hypothetical protein
MNSTGRSAKGRVPPGKYPGSTLIRYGRFLSINFSFIHHRTIRNYIMQLLTEHLGELGCGGMGWIGLALDRDKWRSLVNAVMNLRVS